MTRDIIRKSAEVRAAAAMPDPDATRAEFSWEEARAALDGLPGGGLNMAHEAVDRHVAAGRGANLAIRWLGRDGRVEDLSYADLAGRIARFANLLRELGCQPGERVYSLLGRVPDLYVAALGTLKAGLTFTPLFSAFGPEPIRARMEIGGANVLVTEAGLYRRKVAPWRADLTPLRHVLVTGDEAPADCTALAPALARMAQTADTARTMAETPALIHFTSGTTGKPKGAVHVHGAVVAHAATGRLALEMRPGEIYWCTADPGWVTGTSYGIIAPLVNRVAMIVDEAEFDVARWYDILERERVSIWYTAPTAIRRLMRAGAQAAAGRDFSALRFLSSVGEPLNPEAVVWGQDVFGTPFHDNWWQTETGGIMIANTAAMDVQPGSMGMPMPGIEAAIVSVTADGVEELGIDEVGELALRPGWPSMMREYLGEPARYAECFAGGWYLSGDLARRDGNGSYWFVGRKDDLIKTSGHLVGPFEVESALIEHEAVVEAAVIGLPDDTAGEIVRAYVTLKPGLDPSDALERDIRGHARKRLGAAVAPREITFSDALPKTRSGKIMRRLLKARELGLPEGDTSTLESTAP
ncbi:MAG: acetate--CoA ligase [Pseudomonadota bacterium]